MPCAWSEHALAALHLMQAEALLPCEGFAPCAQWPRGIAGPLPGSGAGPGACSALEHQEPLLATWTLYGGGGGAGTLRGGTICIRGGPGPTRGVWIAYMVVRDHPWGSGPVGEVL
jgi:hypothetical protein